MKKVLISLLLAITTCSCNHIIGPYGKVVGVEENTSSNWEYKVTVKGIDRTSALREMILFTNDKYEIGDTITIVKK